MSFWIVALGMAVAAAALLVLALLRARGEAAAAAYDLGVYRDQLREVEKDVARGILSEEDAARIRAEIGRRVLEADRALSRAAGPAQAPRAATAGAAAFAALAVVAGSVFVYSRIGAPGYPDLPLGARLALAEQARASRPSQAEAEAEAVPTAPPQDFDPGYIDLVNRLRAVVAERPNDVQGLALLARHEAALGNFAAAHAAQARLIAARGDQASATDWAELADLRIRAAGGYVSPEAEEAIMAALARDPRQPVARYYAGLLFAQTARPDLAFRYWAPLLAEGPEEAPWIAPIRAQIAEIAWEAGQHDYQPPPPAAARRGPTQEQMEAAAAMSGEERAEMIRGMVAGLAERLATEGGPASDWARLIRAYGVLGEADRIAPVVAEARERFAGDEAALAEIAAAARAAGIAE
jgi:cytochrome c-type biogenesis protein CcmH